MKKLARSYLIYLSAVFLATQVISGFKVFPPSNLFVVALFLLGVKYVQKPIFTLLILPKNLPFEFLLQSAFTGILFYLLPGFLPQFHIQSFNFSGFSYKGFSVSPSHFELLPSIVVSAIFVTLVVFILDWLAD